MFDNFHIFYQVLHKNMLYPHIIFVFLLFSPATSCPEDTVDGIKTGVCYWVSKKPTYFIQADAECVTRGGHLVSVHDEITNSYVFGISKVSFAESKAEDFWLGGSTLFVPGQLSWSDQTEYNFHPWNRSKIGFYRGERPTAFKDPFLRWLRVWV